MVRAGSNCHEDWQLTKSSVRERFKELLNLSQWTDCAFLVGSGDSAEIVRCHKLVLAASSPVFEAMFYGDFAESSTIMITDIDPATFKLFLKYLYCDSLDLNNIEEAGSILYLAKKYLLPHLSKICLNYLYEHTYLQTLWDILPLAEYLDESHLINLCVKVMCRHKPSIWMKEGEQLSRQVIERLVEEKAMVMSEFELWQLVEQWAKSEGLRMDIGPLVLRLRWSGLTEEEWRDALSSCALTAYCTEAAHLRAVATPARLRPVAVKRLSSREVVWRGRDMALIDGPVTTEVSVTGRILVTGFEVFARSGDFIGNGPRSADFAPRNTIEKFDVEVRNSWGVLNRTILEPQQTRNTEQEVLLSNPVWFEPNEKYSVTFIVKGVYETRKCSNISPTSASLGTYFNYIDRPEPVDPNEHNRFTYISGVLFSL